MKELSELDRKIVAMYRRNGLPKHAEYVETFGPDEFGPWFTGPARQWEDVFAECIRKGKPLSETQEEVPSDILI